ncbi:MAG: sterol desaturase family protein [Bacteroidetes bacterium]|nr:sterol desaturase family protein [Bacteroidota bacterium]
MYARSWNDFLILISARYFIVATIAWLVWYVWLGKKIAFKKIQLKFPSNKDYVREISYSLLTIFIFSLVPTLLLLTPVRQYTQFYTFKPGDEKNVFFWIAFPLMYVVHDAYFYFTHRLMHHPKIFKYVHLTHHQSTNPSPFAAFAFHPIEAVIEAGIFPLLLFGMPLCRWHLFFFFVMQMLYNVYGHLGWELYPKKFSSSAVGKWINTSVCHNQHHHYFKGNYSLYFLWWDRWLGTLRPDYEQYFEEVKNRKKE